MANSQLIIPKPREAINAAEMEKSASRKIVEE